MNVLHNREFQFKMSPIYSVAYFQDSKYDVLRKCTAVYIVLSKVYSFFSSYLNMKYDNLENMINIFSDLLYCHWSISSQVL